MNNEFIHTLANQLINIPTSLINKFKNIIDQQTGSIIILGNGGSNAIASHIAEDYTKILKKRTFNFSDSSRISCYANDYGYEHAFMQFLSEFVDVDSLVILISSSGNSQNIINCAQYCINNNIKFIILSGFTSDNKLRQLAKTAELELWVNSSNYGIVELTHETFLHSIC